MRSLSDDTLSFGREIMAVLLGVDALYRSESGDPAGLVVLNLDTANEYPAEPFDSYREAERRVGELRRRATSLPEADRKTYYDQLCGSTLAFLEWRLRSLSFDAQLERFLHVPVAPASDAQLETLETEVAGLLTDLGYRGALSEQCAAWEERNAVATSDVAATLQSLLAEAWTRTEDRLLEIPAEPTDGMGVRAVSGAPYNARCDYLSRTVEVNTDPVLTKPGLKHLAVHEGCPGHYVQFKLRETMVREGTAAADVLLSVVNTASSSVFEGIADAGLFMLDWIETDDDRVQGLLNRHRAGIGTGAAWRLHHDGWPTDRVADWLSDRSLIGGEGWVDNRMAFIEAPSRAVLIWSYWWGGPSVLPVWERLAPDRRRDFLTYLHGRMHSTATVGMFDAMPGGVA